MITINLISPEHKQELRAQRIFLALREIILLILLFTSIIAIMLWASRYFLEEQLAELITKNAQAINANQEINNRIKNLNLKIDNAAAIEGNFQSWSGLIIKLADLAPAGVSYRELKIFRQEQTIEISGLAQTRNDLSALQKNLETSNLFKQVDLPLNAFINKENNSFNLRAELNLDQIKNL